MFRTLPPYMSLLCYAIFDPLNMLSGILQYTGLCTSLMSLLQLFRSEVWMTMIGRGYNYLTTIPQVPLELRTCR